MKQKLIRITTVAMSLDKLIEGQLAFMNANYEVVGVSSGGETLERVAVKEGIRVIPVEMSRKITPFKDVKSVWELYQLFKKEKPFIVHTHTPKAGIIGMLAAKFANVPIRLHTVAGLPLLEATGFKRKILNTVEKLTYSCATKIYPNSKGLKEIILKEHFTKSDKLKVIANGSSNGIDTTYFNPNNFSNTQKASLRQKLKIQENDFVFIFVGRLVTDKGINELVAAFKKLRANSHPELFEGCYSKLKTQNSKLVLVGPLETNLDPLYSSTLHEIRNNKNIISVGYQQDVRPYFAISNCLVFPSYREGFPNVVLQAGAMGLPSIVTNINGCNEIIEDNKNGWIIPVKKEEAILKAMRNCLVDEVRFNTAKSNARQLIVDRYEQKMVWGATLVAYRELEKTHP
ncbi:glycosyltransferase family 4 protein [Lutibacter sp.]|uniref:glycosyltransferase family 4 protein n=1 Tax=Lutibacter sp. TaxID=1925666 RepID=UPI0025BF500E|nr:glycosyltransferase family 4 protein [Lutibacter sp.]MCF6168474.1 glycosyltransferase family 4 protein [Lutibacter sp.]